MEESKNIETAEIHESDIVYTGDGWDYFKLIFVNFIFTILSFGIYSPWAKVKKTKYLCNSVNYKGSSFDFHADPVKILISRIVVLILFGSIIGLSILIPMVNFLVTTLVLAMAPILIFKGIQFKVNNTSFRNIRFHFKLDIKKVYKAILKTPFFIYSLSYSLVIGILFLSAEKTITDQGQKLSFSGSAQTAIMILSVCGLLVSLWTLFRASKYLTAYVNTIYDNIFYGGSKLNSNINKEIVSKEIVMPYLKGIFKVIGSLIVVAVLNYYFSAARILFVFIAFTVPVYLAFLNFKFQHDFILTIWNNASFEDNKFQSNLRLSQFVETIIVNAILTAVTLGLYYPFALIKMQKVLWRSRSLNIEDLDHVVTHAKESETALMEELSDVFDFDFDIAL